MLRNRDVLVLTASYLCMNYVYYLLANWCFLYLVQERHFTVLESGCLASTPPLAAAVGAGVGGWLASVLGTRYGIRRGLRILPLISLPAAGVLLFLAVDAANPYLAVAALALCFACVELNEGPYWAAIMHVGRADTMAAAGLLNTGGNVGGLIGHPDRGLPLGSSCLDAGVSDRCRLCGRERRRLATGGSDSAGARRRPLTRNLGCRRLGEHRITIQRAAHRCAGRADPFGPLQIEPAARPLRAAHLQCGAHGAAAARPVDLSGERRVLGPAHRLQCESIAACGRARPEGTAAQADPGAGAVGLGTVDDILGRQQRRADRAQLFCRRPDCPRARAPG